jgi:putative flippase GtrA
VIKSLRLWMKFNTVGVFGMGVHLVVLTVLRTGLKVGVLAATVIAVETAVLHNFVWHERWTWVERTRSRTAGVLDRLIRFHLANGVISIGGNLLMMWALVSKLGVHYLVASIAAIGTCAVLNFAASDRLVFRREH